MCSHATPTAGNGSRGLTCRWDPRYGEKERSGVIRVGKEAARDLLSAGDVLAVTVAADGCVRLV